jgi:hypothetical protein
MKRHLPEPAQFSRLRKYLAALPLGIPTSFTWVLAAAVVATPILTVRAILPALGGGARDRVEEVQPNVAVVDDRGREGSQAAWTVTQEIAASPGVADPGSNAHPRLATAASPVPRRDGGDQAQDPVDEASADATPSIEPAATTYALSDTYLTELGQADREPDTDASSRDRSAGTVVESAPAPSISASGSESTPNPDYDDRVEGPGRDQPSLEDKAPTTSPEPGGIPGPGEASDEGEASDNDREGDHRQIPGPVPGQPSPTSSPENGDD